MTLPENTILDGRYRIERLLSQGGMGTIYQGFDIKLQIAVAIKENFFQTTQAVQQFEQEALILARLQHPNLPRVSDHFSFGYNQYLVMDFIEGRDLWELFEANGGPLNEAITLDYILQVGEAVSYLHRQNPPIIHRDIKPQNIKITPDGRAVLVDFGIAKVIIGDGRTRTGAQAATPGFSPPEQYSGAGTTPRSDLYSLGATLYAVLTGEYPPDSISLLSGDEVYEPPESINKYLSQAVSAAIEQAMQLRQQDRPESVDRWLQELRAILAGNADSIQPLTTETAVLTSRMRATQPVLTAAEPTSPVPRYKPPWLWLVAVMTALALATSVTAFIFGQSRGYTPLDTETVLKALAATATQQARSGSLNSDGPNLAATLAALAATATTQAQNQPIAGQPEATPTPSPTATATVTHIPPAATPSPSSTATTTLHSPTFTPTRRPSATAPPSPPAAIDRQIAFVSNRGGSDDIFLMAADGSRPINYTATSGDHETSPTWSPDGQRLAFAAVNISEDQDFFFSTIRAGQIDGGEISVITTQAGQPAWSPDGSRFAVGSMGDYISLFEVETKQIRRLTPGLGYRAAWSPDGTRLAFDNNSDIFVIDAAGVELVQLTSSSADEVEPAWSPDGRQLAFASNGEGNWEIYLMNADGSNGRRLTNHPADDRQPTWSPDGTRLAFASNRSGNWDIYRMAADGGEVTNITNHPAADTQPTWSPVP
ncbi:MAG: PD40 domain-containing protein [Anaerolineae bacterium]|nr:PD40 domain-containing protein [Anaerolineae bacterium]